MASQDVGSPPTCCFRCRPVRSFSESASASFGPPLDAAPHAVVSAPAISDCSRGMACPACQSAALNASTAIASVAAGAKRCTRFATSARCRSLRGALLSPLGSRAVTVEEVVRRFRCCEGTFPGGPSGLRPRFPRRPFLPRLCLLRCCFLCLSVGVVPGPRVGPARSRARGATGRVPGTQKAPGNEQLLGELLCCGAVASGKQST